MGNIIDKIQISGQSYDVKDSSAATVVELTQQEYDVLPASAKTSNTLFVITDAQPIDITQYWTSAQTQSAINQATSGKVDSNSVVSSVTSASTDNEIPTAKAVYDAIPTGGTSFDLPIYSGTANGALKYNNSGNTSSGNYSNAEGNQTSATTHYAHAEGQKTIASGQCSHAEGYNTKAGGIDSHAEGGMSKAFGDYSHAEGSSTKANGESSHAEGYSTNADGNYSHTEGSNTTATSISNVAGIITYYGYQARHAEGSYTLANNASTHTEGYKTSANNFAEHASGVYNVSSTASTTFGDSGNTLFSVGNGTADNARHNAFEIRQNGDIYCSDGTNDVKLQDTITATAANTTALGGLKLLKLTQSAYDALSPDYDSNTLYVING